jgi:predicted DNA-binding transcriptional regulator AlpA
MPDTVKNAFTTPQGQTPQFRNIRAPLIDEITGTTDMTRRRLEAIGKFPKRFKLSALSGKFGGVAWDYDEVMAWLVEQRKSREIVGA